MRDRAEPTGKSGGIQVISRAAAILRALRLDTSGLSLGQIAERVGLPRSTVQRIVNALREEHLVTSTAGDGGLRLGPEISALAEAIRYSLVDLCRPHLARLSAAVGETVDLSVLRGSDIIFIDQIPGTHRLRTVSAVGDVFPLTTTANGRAILAMLDRNQARTLVEAEWRAGAVVGNWRRFARLLDDVTETGLAYDRDEHTEGISAIGAAFADARDGLHAVSVPVPSSRFREKKRLVETRLMETVENIRATLPP